MVLLIGATLAVVSIAILVYPFLKARLRPRREDSLGGASGKTPRLEAIYQEISTLRLEYQLGKVPEDVYRELLRVYRLEAAVALREQAQACPEPGRRAGEPVPGEASPPNPLSISDGEGAGGEAASLPGRCPHCGVAVGRGDRDCHACDASHAGSKGDAP